MNFTLLRRFFFAALLVCATSFATTGTVLILHTNDLHDHVRPGYDGEGGMPCIAGYVKQVRGTRHDVLLLDAGDVTEKGDLVSYKTDSEIMYEAMATIGYDAAAIGNHDWARGVEHVRHCGEIAKMPLLCANYLDKDGSPVFPPSAILDVNGVKVGIIGLTKEKIPGILDVEESGKILEKEAEKLDAEAKLIVVVCHLGSRDCKALAKLAPNVDVFVSGHTHEVLKAPVTADTGALIVQAGEYAEYVGRLDLTIDLDTERILDAKGELVPMTHAAIAPDPAVAELVAARENAVCPEAARNVGVCNAPVHPDGVAVLVAEALRRQAKADIGLCHPGKVLRSGLPQGSIDVNALFCTGGQRGNDIYLVHLSGAEIVLYFNNLLEENNGGTQWTGFHAKRVPTREGRRPDFLTDLDPGRIYTVALTEMEWKDRLEKDLNSLKKNDAAWAGMAHPEQRGDTTASFTFIEAFTALADQCAAEGKSLDAAAAELESAARLE